jgi:hypothetical protein
MYVAIVAVVLSDGASWEALLINSFGLASVREYFSQFRN